MDITCLVSNVQAGEGGEMEWRKFPCHTVGPNNDSPRASLNGLNLPSNTYMTSNLSSNCYIQPDDTPHHKANATSNRFHEYNNEFSGL